MRNAYFILGIGFIILALAYYASMPVTPESSLQLTSTSFKTNTAIPSKYTCDADNVSPSLSIAHVPEGTKSLVLILEDRDIPKELKPDGIFDHWLLYNISPATTEIPEGSMVGTPGLNGAGKTAYVGPCPPSEYEPSEHRYFFKLYALDTMLSFTNEPSKAQLEKAMEGHTLSSTQLIGRYQRVKK